MESAENVAGKPESLQIPETRIEIYRVRNEELVKEVERVYGKEDELARLVKIEYLAPDGYIEWTLGDVGTSITGYDSRREAVVSKPIRIEKNVVRVSKRITSLDISTEKPEDFERFRQIILERTKDEILSGIDYFSRHYKLPDLKMELNQLVQDGELLLKHRKAIIEEGKNILKEKEEALKNSRALSSPEKEKYQQKLLWINRIINGEKDCSYSTETMEEALQGMKNEFREYDERIKNEKKFSEAEQEKLKYSFEHYRTYSNEWDEVIIILADGTVLSPTREVFPSKGQERKRLKFRQEWDFVPPDALIILKRGRSGDIQQAERCKFETKQKPVSLSPEQERKLKMLGINL